MHNMKHIVSKFTKSKLILAHCTLLRNVVLICLYNIACRDWFGNLIKLNLLIKNISTTSILCTVTILYPGNAL